jgi:hypothetical protein
VAAGDHGGSWILTGHDSDESLSSETIRKAKDKVFGKRQGDSHLLFFHRHHGIVTHPAVGQVTHQDIHANPRHLRQHINQGVRARVSGMEKADVMAQGRIEHHKRGGGMISVAGRSPEGDDAPVHPSVIRSLRRAYPKHFIHDGHGNELHENWSYAHDFHSMPDDEKKKYVYHVTTAARAAKIVKGGLKPRTAKGRTNYPDIPQHTKGRAFITNHHGVRYWVDQTAHAVGRRKREVDERDYENIHVLKHPIANLKKSTRRKLRTDDIGTKDSRRNSDIMGPSSHEAPHAMFATKNIGGRQSKRKPRRIAEGKLDFKNFLIEQNMEMVNNFIDFAAERLGLNGTPTVSFVDRKDENMSTACYDPTDRSIRILKGTRATFDVCRSIAHEMVHQLQHERGDELDGTTGSPCEDEANALAGRLIRMYAQDNPMFYEE